MTDGVRIREARLDDAAAVADFTSDTWSDHGREDYLPRVFEEWVRANDERRRTFVACDGSDAAVGLSQVVMLTDDEAWGQGLRVAPRVRDRNVGSKLSRAGFEWARERGATVVRGMVFSWNVMGLGHARANGFDPAAEFRFVHPEPDAGAAPDLPVHDDPAAAWRYWTDSDARSRLRGLAMSPVESWALSELTRGTLREAASADGLFVVDDGGTGGIAFRAREYETDGESAGRVAIYGVGEWDDRAACRSLLDAVARDAGARGVDTTRLLVPETPRHVSDVAEARTEIADGPDFVMAADLTDESLVNPE
ncbi:hypothetical protein C474_06150 [Halogeometricum pallidum JCM 14848]|uniref:N-acetyltransferase domain-containing protein n=1 Tax=Halogeometricum pallidum JCM 14848 TaxID=1227487 RepID=M0DDK8_HALPD|nr:GNAT family N-acetyltransferase [Halogeometricum pallidum]ELZ32832.1 hypothetical protein C474_06150 [Halogeometricum pallidum JCM 14848]